MALGLRLLDWLNRTDSEKEDAMDAIPEFRRDVVVSVRPIYASKILHGQKTVKLRRKFPEVGSTGALVLIYSSSPVSVVVGCARITCIEITCFPHLEGVRCCDLYFKARVRCVFCRPQARLCNPF